MNLKSNFMEEEKMGVEEKLWTILTVAFLFGFIVNRNCVYCSPGLAA